jgi:hypothetical protein
MYHDPAPHPSHPCRWGLSHTHAAIEDAPALGVVWFGGHATHSPSAEYNPRGHSAIVFDPSHPYPPGHAAHTVSFTTVQSAARSHPVGHDEHGSHHDAPPADHSPGGQRRCVPLMQALPGAHGQHTAGWSGVQGESWCSPGAQPVQIKDAKNTVSISQGAGDSILYILVGHCAEAHQRA